MIEHTRRRHLDDADLLRLLAADPTNQDLIRAAVSRGFRLATLHGGQSDGALLWVQASPVADGHPAATITYNGVEYRNDGPQQAGPSTPILGVELHRYVPDQ